MSCGLVIAAALAFSSADAAAAADLAAAPAPAVANAPLASEPLFAEIVSRSKLLRAQVDGHLAAGQVADLPALQAEVARLAALDMEGHVTLKARGTDGDLKCILKGISEDLPKRLDEVARAETPDARVAALKEMRYLLNDNVEVVTSPPGPKTPPPAEKP